MLKNTKRKVMATSANQDKNTKKGVMTSCTNQEKHEKEGDGSIQKLGKEHERLALIIHSFTYWNRGLVLRLVLKPYPNLGLGCRLVPKPQVDYGWVPSAWNRDYLQITD